MEFKGKVIVVCPLKSGTKKDGSGTWKSQQYVVENTEGKYPSRLVCDVFGEENINKFGIKQGDEVCVEYSVDASEWQGRWFGRNNAYRITNIGSVVGKAEQPKSDVESKDDLPF